ncbi:TrmH family RNA methyltransferase [Planctomicrobium sp. SH527]|uniref:TrmH family RNA methyltransferase n=1 Tax=Planctomicrobium sp. SH527 TaxID=3448123 RepID=UPI003F5BF714
MPPKTCPPIDKALARYLQSFITEQRSQRFAEVLKWRTDWVRIGLVDLYQQHNASAVLRTCDAMGVQHVHIVETYNEFETNPDVALGSQQWLSLHQHNGPNALQECISGLKAEGIRVAAAVLHKDSKPIQELPIDRPVTVLFGNEKEGLPDAAIEAADDLVHLPMYGFVESYNVSVAAALTMQLLTDRLHASLHHWQLSEYESTALLLEWSRLSIRHIESVERQFHHEWNAGRISVET